MKNLHTFRRVTPATKLGMPTAIIALSLFVLLGGCASTPVSIEQMAAAEAAVQAANNSSTSERAGAELQIAIAKLASARQAVANKDYERAKQLAAEAELDARVAQLHAQTVASRKAAQDSQDAARVLREELNRKSPN